MKVLIISCSPNKDGLTAACAEQARKGAEDGGLETNVFYLNDMNVGNCQACNKGWGSCRDMHVCQIKDGFQFVYDALQDCDALVISTPVYWGEMSESAKALLDRTRRCEGLKKDGHYLKDKPVISIAAAGGTGNGVIGCSAQIEKWIDQVKGLKFDFIGVTRRNREYKLKAIYEAAKAAGASLSKV